MPNREEVYAAIDSERDYQDAICAENDWRDMSVGEEVLLIHRYLAQATEAWATEGQPEINTLNIVRKIAGIAVRCMEIHGAPEREG